MTKVELEALMTATAMGASSYPVFVSNEEPFNPMVVFANRDQLEDYWKHGPGAAKIRWGTPGDWTRCYRHISKHVEDDFAKRICAQWHKDMDGFYPGDKRNK